MASTESNTVQPAPMNVILAAIRNRDTLELLKSKSEEKRRRQIKGETNDISGASARAGGSGAAGAATSSSISLAEEMRLKLERRHKILSGQQDDEEQAQAKAQKHQLQNAILSAQGARRLRATQTNAQRSPELEQRRDGLLSLKGIGSLSDILKAKDEQQQQSLLEAASSDSEFSWED
jgi:hypothetical protein